MFSPAANAVEYGHGFDTAAAYTLTEARGYIHEMPPNVEEDMVLMSAVYPRGLEAASGPIRRVVIPVDSAQVTGTIVSSLRPLAAILLTPEQSDVISLNNSVADSVILLSFNTQQYAQALFGKRILAVNVLYGMQKSLGDSTVDPYVALTTIPIGIQGGYQYIPYGIPEGSASVAGVLRIRLGDFCPLWQSPITRDMVPWNYTDLERFDSSSVNNRLFVQFALGTNYKPTTPNNFADLWYAALEVIYCEEQRLIVGGRGPLTAPGGGIDNIQYGANPINLRYPTNHALLPVLPIGSWTVTLSSADQGDAQTIRAGYPDMNALRELYQIPPHPGKQLNIPFPPEDNVGKQLAEVVTHVLPQISLHTSGGPLTEVHAYGRQGPAPVYGGITAIQDIYDDLIGASYQYPQVRFYARKFDTTTVPLRLDSPNVTGTGLAVQITPAEHDALPEIVDGWKECTLRFPTAPAMGTVAGFPAWRFSSVGELGGSQWQVLSACAPAVSGLPGNLLANVPAPHRLGVATYQPAFGDTVELTWMSPIVSGATADPDCDATLIFSQDPAAVTGVSLSQATQTVTGIGLSCGSVPCCIPTGIGYNRITWGLPTNTGIADDNFDRIVAAGGWGNASDGKAWTTSGTAGDFSVDGDEGFIDVSATGSDRHAWVNVGGPDQDVTVAIRIDEAAETSQLRGAVEARLTDANNQYRAEIRYTSTDIVRLILLKNVAGVATQLGSIIDILSLRPAQTTPRMIRIQVQGSIVRAKTWDSDQSEPWWQITVTDTALTTGNNVGVYARDDTTTATSIFYYTAFTVRPPDFAFGGIELQRWDPRTGGEFQTIMLASSPAVTGFSDYEARVGASSVYRVRNINIYNFAGPWSTYVTGAPPAPGVTGPGGCDLTGALLFTSNAEQTGILNCAYIPQWLSDPPTEGFSLPEAQRVSYQELYGQNGRVAFHGTERGLEAFSRNLLIQAGAVDPTVLANVRTLREMAWADLPYVCVRDDIGNRWYANVRVPDVAAQDNRGKILAAVDIIETTTQPWAVDPA